VILPGFGSPFPNITIISDMTCFSAVKAVFGRLRSLLTRKAVPLSVAYLTTVVAGDLRSTDMRAISPIATTTTKTSSTGAVAVIIVLGVTCLNIGNKSRTGSASKVGAGIFGGFDA
jgi:hypothetical protein